MWVATRVLKRLLGLRTLEFEFRETLLDLL